MAEKFKVIEKLGEGHFATTFLANVTDQDLQKKYGEKQVVLKEPHKQHEALETIKEESRLFNLIEKGYKKKDTHENVVQYFDFEQYKNNIVIVVEYVPDGNLRDLIGIQKDRKKLDIDIALKLMQGMLAGTQFIHWKRILHRDLKPENILLSRYEENDKEFYTPKISDFGCSRLLSPKDLARTPAGSPPYIAPEFYFTGAASFNWDIWSLGVIFYEMLAGHHPFDDSDFFANQMGYYTKIYEDGTLEKKPLHEENPEVPLEISEFIDKCLEKKPENRYQTGKKARTAFNEICAYLDLVKMRKAAEDDKQFVKQAQKFIRKYPTNPKGYELLGCYYSDKRDYLQALGLFEKGIEHCPESGDLYYWAAQNLDINKEPDRAIWYYEKAIEHEAKGKYKKIAKLRCKQSGSS